MKGRDIQVLLQTITQIPQILPEAPSRTGETSTGRRAPFYWMTLKRYGLCVFVCTLAFVLLCPTEIGKEL